jgi:hypothetical protein
MKTVTFQKGNDGWWLHIDSGAGQKASINLGRNENTTIIRSVLEQVRETKFVEALAAGTEETNT